jgi:translation elongation factor EF-Tu-like GTPase
MTQGGSAPRGSDEEAFRLRVHGAFAVHGRGTFVFGLIEGGVVRVGDEVDVRRGGQTPLRTTVTAVEFVDGKKDAQGRPLPLIGLA